MLCMRLDAFFFHLKVFRSDNDNDQIDDTITDSDWVSVKRLFLFVW